MNGNYSTSSEKSFDQVWEKAIDLFAERGLPIQVIDKASGLIVSGDVSLRYTYEDKNGKPTNAQADVVIYRIYNSGARMNVQPYSVTAQWNVRIKRNADNTTFIGVNLASPRYRSLETTNYSPFSKGYIQSLGTFERQVAEFIK